MEEKKLTKLIESAIGGFSRNEFCRRAGISAGNLSRIMHGQRPSPDVLRKIAAASADAIAYKELMVAAQYVEEESGGREEGDIPIYGSIAAGGPVEAYEDYMGSIRLNSRLVGNPEEYFALKVVGDSMDMANIPDGSIVVIHRQTTLNDGEIGAVLVNGEATVKRVYNKSTHIMLMPVSRNPVYQPQIYWPEDNVSVLGKVVLSMVEVG